MSRPLLELLEKARLREHDRVPYYRGDAVITLADYEAALRAQRDEWKRKANASARSGMIVVAMAMKECAADIDADGEKL